MIETRTDHPLVFDSPALHGETIVCSPLSFWLGKADVLAGAARLVSRERIVQMEKFKPSILLLYIRGEVSGNSEDQQTFEIDGFSGECNHQFHKILSFNTSLSQYIDVCSE